MKKAELVFIPLPGIGHLVSTVEMAKLLIERDERLSITVLIMKLPFETKVANYIESLSAASYSRMRLVELPQEEFSFGGSRTSLFELIDSYKAKVRDFLAEISSSDSAKPAGVIIDMFCTSMIDVVNEFGAPSFIFYTSGSGMLGLVLHLQSLRDDFNEDVTNYKDSNVEFAVPTYVNPVPDKVLPSIIFDKEGCKAFLDQAKRYKETKGILINSFMELEYHAVQALSKDKNIPPVYAVGPILNLQDSSGSNQENETIMKWLNLHPESSIVFLCFGSFGYFDGDQIKEIANALEGSGCRFLWSLRKPPAGSMFECPGEYENLEEVLPEGFLQRTEGIGKVIGWAPQMAVLSHPAVGGFVSHCGWNSTLESIWFGVPMATWPLYAEQQINAFELVKDLEMAVEIKMDYRKDFGIVSDIVSADVIENGIRRLMDPENEIRNKVKEMKEKSRMALKEGGSSSTSLRCFIDDVTNSIP